MPLQPGNNRAAISANIHELSHAATKRPHNQIVAIALHKARAKRKAPGLPNPNGVKTAGVKMEPGAKIMHASGDAGADE